MLNKHRQIKLYIEDSIESLKQALANLSGYENKECRSHINDALSSIYSMKDLSKELEE